MLLLSLLACMLALAPTACHATGRALAAAATPAATSSAATSSTTCNPVGVDYNILNFALNLGEHTDSTSRTCTSRTRHGMPPCLPVDTLAILLARPQQPQRQGVCLHVRKHGWLAPRRECMYG